MAQPKQNKKKRYLGILEDCGDGKKCGEQGTLEQGEMYRKESLSEQGNTQRREKQAERQAQRENVVQLSSHWGVWRFGSSWLNLEMQRWVLSLVGGERGADIRLKTTIGTRMARRSGEREVRKAGTLRHFTVRIPPPAPLALGPIPNCSCRISRLLLVPWRNARSLGVL